MQSDLAPIGLSTYSRLGHLKQTVTALQNNELATESELYIFSDAPKLGDEDKVQAVRDYLKTINGFKKVYVYERKENDRVANNRGGMRMLLEKYEQFIFVEEDVVTSPYFLRFMNDALRVYKNDESVLAVTGYGSPISYPDNYAWDMVKSKRMFCWAFAIWRTRFQAIEVDITPEDYWRIRLNPFLSYKYIQAGEDGLSQLKAIAFSKVEALDIRIDFTLYKQKKFVISPKISMINSIGLDGTGENWDVPTNKFDVHLASIPLIVDKDISTDIRVLRRMAALHKITNKEWVTFLLSDIGLFDFVFYMKKKLTKKNVIQNKDPL